MRPWRLSSPAQAVKAHQPLDEAASTPLPRRGDFPPSLTRVHKPLVRRADPEPAPVRVPPSLRGARSSVVLSRSTSVLAAPVVTPSTPALATAPATAKATPAVVAEPPSSLVTTGLVTASAASEASPEPQADMTEGLTSTVVVTAAPSVTEPTEVVIEVTSTAQQLQTASLQALSSSAGVLEVEGWKVVVLGVVGAVMLA